VEKIFFPQAGSDLSVPIVRMRDEDFYMGYAIESRGAMSCGNERVTKKSWPVLFLRCHNGEGQEVDPDVGEEQVCRFEIGHLFHECGI